MFALALLVYMLTLAPTVTLEDSGSFITAAWHLGVAHPPGYPLWCLLAHAFTHLPFGSIAERVHFCSAIFAAATAVILFLIARRLACRVAVAWAAALAFAFSAAFWSQAVIAEVYTLHAFLLALAIHSALQWRDTGRLGSILRLALAFGLGLANHTSFALFAPVLAVWAFIPRWRKILRWKPMVFGAALFMLGLSLYAYLPLRARAQPPVNWGEPVTVKAAVDHVLRRAYFAEPEQDRYVGSAQDTARHILAAAQGCGDALTWPLALAALMGGWVLWRRRRDVGLVTLVMLVLNIGVLNMVLSGMATPDELYTRRVFYIPAHMLLAVWLAVALNAMAGVMERHWPLVRKWAASALLLLPLLPLAANYRACDRAEDTLARDFGLDLMASAPANAGLFFLHDETLFPCVYLKWVEGIRPDIQVLVPFFGYRGEPLSAVLSDVPVNTNVVKYYSFLDGAVAVPWGLGYRLLKQSENGLPLLVSPAVGSFTDPKEPLHCDPASKRVYAIYARYHAREGARLFLSGHHEAAEREWAKAERLKGEDAYAHYLLAGFYRQCGVRSDAVEPLLVRAKTLYARHYSPNDYRWYPLSPAEVRAGLRTVP